MKNVVEYKALSHFAGDKDVVIDFGNKNDAGFDMINSAPDDVVLQPGEDFVFPTGLCVHIGSAQRHDPSDEEDINGFGLFGMVVPRSGLGFKHYTRLANTCGIIDASYQKEIMVKIRNESDHEITIKRGERMCQMIFVPYFAPTFKSVEHFSETSDRGGFGSTGRM